MKKQRIFTKKHFAPLLILVAAFLLLAAPKVNASAASKKPGAVTGFTAKSDHDYGGIKLKWKKVRHAKYYEIYWKKSKKGKFERYWDITYTPGYGFEIGSDFQLGKTYYFKVRAVNGKKKGKFSPVKSAKAVLRKPDIRDLSLKSENSISMGIDLNYSSYPNLKGAELYRATSKNGKYTKVKIFKKKVYNHYGDYNSYYHYTNTKLSPGEYFYKVRNYAKIKGKKVYSKFSSVESIIVPKKVEITMDNWMQYYELSPLDCELDVNKNSFGEVTDSYIDYWKGLQLKSNYHLDDRYDEDSSVAVELEYTENRRECAIDWNTGKIIPGAIVPYHDDYEEKDIYTETHTTMKTIASSLTLSSGTVHKNSLEEPSKTTAWIVDDINMKRIKGTIYLDKW